MKYFEDFMAGIFLAHTVTFGDFMAGDFMAGTLYHFLRLYGRKFFGRRLFRRIPLTTCVGTALSATRLNILIEF